VFISVVYFVIDSVRKHLDIPSYVRTTQVTISTVELIFWFPSCSWQCDCKL